MSNSGIPRNRTLIADTPPSLRPERGYVRKSAGKATIKVKRVKGASGYQYKIAQNKMLTKKAKVKTSAKRNVTFSNLSSGKKYYAKVRAYRIDANGQTVFGKWSAAKPVKVKKARSIKLKSKCIGKWNGETMGIIVVKSNGTGKATGPCAYYIGPKFKWKKSGSSKITIKHKSEKWQLVYDPYGRGGGEPCIRLKPVVRGYNAGGDPFDKM